MLKTYQFKTLCKGDIHSSKTANIILPGFMTEYRWTPLPVLLICPDWAAVRSACTTFWRQQYTAMTDNLAAVLSAYMARWSCVSSAYWWYWTPWLVMTAATGLQ